LQNKAVIASGVFGAKLARSNSQLAGTFCNGNENASPDRSGEALTIFG